MMTAKLRVSNVFENKDEKGNVTSIQLTMLAVSTKPFDADGLNDDNSYARWTPSASLSMTITNPALFGKFSEGQQFYLNFGDAAVSAPVKPEAMAAAPVPSPIPTDLEAMHGKITQIHAGLPSIAEGINNCWQGLIGLRTALENHVAQAEQAVKDALAPKTPEPPANPPADTSAAPQPPTSTAAPIVPAEPQNLAPVTVIVADHTPQVG